MHDTETQHDDTELHDDDEVRNGEVRDDNENLRQWDKVRSTLLEKKATEASKEIFYKSGPDLKNLEQIQHELLQKIFQNDAFANANRAELLKMVTERVKALAANAKNHREKEVAGIYEDMLNDIPLDFTVRVRVKAANENLGLMERLLTSLHNRTIGIRMSTEDYGKLVVEASNLRVGIDTIDQEILELENDRSNVAEMLKMASEVGFWSMFHQGFTEGVKAGVSEYREARAKQNLLDREIAQKKAERMKKENEYNYRMQLLAAADDELKNRHDQAEAMFRNKFQSELTKLVKEKNNLADSFRKDPTYVKALQSLHILLAPSERYSRAMVKFQHRVVALRNRIRKFGFKIGVKNLENFLNAALDLDLEANPDNAKPYNKASDTLEAQAKAEEAQKQAEAAAKAGRDTSTDKASEAQAAKERAEAEAKAKAELEKQQIEIGNCRVFLKEINEEEVREDVVKSSYKFLKAQPAYRNINKILKNETLKVIFKFFISGKFSDKVLLSNPTLLLDMESIEDFHKLFKFCHEPGGLLHYPDELESIFKYFVTWKLPVALLPDYFDQILSEVHKNKSKSSEKNGGFADGSKGDGADKSSVDASDKTKGKGDKSAGDTSKDKDKDDKISSGSSTSGTSDKSSESSTDKAKATEDKGSHDAGDKTKGKEDKSSPPASPASSTLEDVKILKETLREIKEAREEIRKAEKALAEAAARKDKAMEKEARDMMRTLMRAFQEQIADAEDRLSAKAEGLGSRVSAGKADLGYDSEVEEDIDRMRESIDEGKDGADNEMGEPSENPEVLKANTIASLKIILGKDEKTAEGFYEEVLKDVKPEHLKLLLTYTREIKFFFSGFYEGENYLEGLGSFEKPPLLAYPEDASDESNKDMREDILTLLNPALLPKLKTELKRLKAHKEERAAYFVNVNYLSGWFKSLGSPTRHVNSLEELQKKREFILFMKKIWDQEKADLSKLYNRCLKDFGPEKLQLLREYQEEVNFLYNGKYEGIDMFEGASDEEKPYLLDKRSSDVVFKDLTKLLSADHLTVLQSTLREIKKNKGNRKQYFASLQNHENKRGIPLLDWVVTLKHSPDRATTGDGVDAASATPASSGSSSTSTGSGSSTSTPASASSSSSPSPSSSAGSTSTPSPAGLDLKENQDKILKEKVISACKVIWSFDERKRESIVDYILEECAEEAEILYNFSLEIKFLYSGVWQDKNFLKLAEKRKMPGTLHPGEKVIRRKLKSILNKPILEKLRSELENMEKMAPDKVKEFFENIHARHNTLYQWIQTFNQ